MCVVTRSTDFEPQPTESMETSLVSAPSLCLTLFITLPIGSKNCKRPRWRVNINSYFGFGSP
jgi:hypothetical protein